MDSSYIRKILLFGVLLVVISLPLLFLDLQYNYWPVKTRFENENFTFRVGEPISFDTLLINQHDTIPLGRAGFSVIVFPEAIIPFGQMISNLNQEVGYFSPYSKVSATRCALISARDIGNLSLVQYTPFLYSSTSDGKQYMLTACIDANTDVNLPSLLIYKFVEHPVH